MKTIKPLKRDPHICTRCSSQEVSVQHHSDVIDFKGLTLEVEGLAETVCNGCGLRWTTDGQEQDNLNRLKSAFAIKRDAVRDNEGLLTGEQIAFILDQLGITRSEAAQLFGGGPHAFGKYVTGEVLQSFPMDRLLRLTLAVGEQAVRYLRLGRHATLKLNAAGYFVAPPVPTTVSIATPSTADSSGLRMVHALPTTAES